MTVSEHTSPLFPPVALGTWSWGAGAAGGDQVFGNQLDTTDLQPVFEAALARNLTLFDTAQVYGMGSSEQILGSLIASHPEHKVQISTKFTPQIAGDGHDPVAEMLHGSFDNLGVNFVDLYWVHNPSDVERWTPLLAPLVKEGLVGGVGVSNHNLAQIQRAQVILGEAGVPLRAVQNHYSLLYRSSEDAGILDYCHEHGIAFFSYMVLEQGALSGKYDAQNLMPQGSNRAATYNPILPLLDDLFLAMRNIAAHHECTVAQVAIAWAIAKGTIPIIGVTHPQQVVDVAGAANVALTVEETNELERLAIASGAQTRGSWEAPMA